MFSQFLLIALSIGLGSTSTCNFSNGGVRANWKIVNRSLQIHYTNARISNNQWTAIGFGPGMQNLNVIVFLVQNGRVQVRTGKTNGYRAPTFDNRSSVNVHSSNISGTTLNVLITVPLNFNGMNLLNCQTWNFVQTGQLMNGQLSRHTTTPFRVNNVCASQCR
uniref:DOMON domain-containing protein n=1 Tax=Caenorhabditis japonica TaxID=281687 RepID=A0A8R1DKM0_CAEJA